VSEQERRLTPTERLYELSMAWAQRGPVPAEQSVDITRNAKGDWQFSVTVRGHDIDDVLMRAMTAAGQLEARYPRASEAAS
jgi:hypothetical protein